MNKKLIEAICDQMGLSDWAVRLSDLDVEVARLIRRLPKPKAECRIRGHMKGMHEPGVVGGYMKTGEGTGADAVKALVIYEDRFDGDRNLYELVPLQRVGTKAKPKVSRDPLSLRRF